MKNIFSNISDFSNPSYNGVVEGILGLSCTYIYTFYQCSSDFIYYSISIYLHTHIGYDDTSDNNAIQVDGAKVKVTEAIFFRKKKLCHHSSPFIDRTILISLKYLV